MKKYALLMLALIFMTACTESGPKKTLNQMSEALSSKNPNLFLAQFDMTRFAEAQVSNMTKNSEPLRALDSVSKMLGIGSMSKWLGAVHDAKKQETDNFTRGVSTGELVLICRESRQPNCPWEPEALLNAEVVELTENMAVAQVTTPTNISSWLALAKKGEEWKVVGMSPLKDDAVSYAEGKEIENNTVAPSPDAPAPPPAPKKEKTEAPVRF